MKRVFLSGLLLLSLSCTREKGEVIYYKGIINIPSSARPYDVLPVADQFISNQVFSGLFKINPRLEITKDILHLWSLDKGKTLYSFELKKGLKFSDGTDMKTEDIIRSFEYLGKNCTTCRDFFENIQYIRPSSEYEFAIQLKRPDYSFINKISSPSIKIFKKKDGRYIGGGPFVPVLIEKKRIVLEKNKFYPGSNNIDRFILLEMTEEEALEKIKSGAIHDTVHFVSLLHFPPKEAIYDVIRRPLGNTWLLSMNVKAPILKDKNLRKCLQDHFPKEEIVQTFLKDHRIAEGFAPFSLVGNYKLRKKEKGPCPPTATDITLDVPMEIFSAKEICTFIKKSYEKQKIKIRCNPIRFSTLVERITSAKAQLSFLAMTLDRPDKAYFFEVFSPNASFSLSNYESEEIDTLLKRIQTLEDTNLRNELFLKANQMIHDEALVMPLSYPDHIAYHNKCVKNLDIGLMGSAYVDYTKVTIEGSCK